MDKEFLKKKLMLFVTILWSPPLMNVQSVFWMKHG